MSKKLIIIIFSMVLTFSVLALISPLSLFFLSKVATEIEPSKSVKGTDGTEYTNYKSACLNQDFVAAHEWIEKYGGTEEDKEYVFNAEMLYLVSQNTEESSNRILYLLAEYSIPGTPVSPNRKYLGDECIPVKKYMEGISRYNNRCNSVLSMAISQRNEALARQVVDLFKQNVDIKKESDSYYKEIEISSEGYNNTDKDAAKERLKEAIEQGAFD